MFRSASALLLVAALTATPNAEAGKRFGGINLGGGAVKIGGGGIQIGAPGRGVNISLPGHGHGRPIVTPKPPVIVQPPRPPIVVHPPVKPCPPKHPIHPPIVITPKPVHPPIVVRPKPICPTPIVTPEPPIVVHPPVQPQPIHPQPGGWYFGMACERVQTQLGVGLRLSSVTHGAPAHAYGLAAGDVLLLAGQVNLSQATSNTHGVQLIQSAVSPQGTVAFTLLRGATGQLANVTMAPQLRGGAPAPTATATAPLALNPAQPLSTM